MDSHAQSTAADRELVLRARAGDGQAVAELYRRFWRAARASAYAIVRDVATAEDAASEAFRLALAGVKTLRDPNRFAPWLRRIVRRVASRSATAAARESEPLDEAALSAADPGDALERRELALLVWQAVERLPPAEREAIVLYYFEGYPGDDAARFIDIPVGTLRRRLHDGRLRLRKYLTDVRAGQRANQQTISELRARIDALLSADAPPEEWYAVTRHVLLRRPVSHQLLAPLIGAFGSAAPMPMDFGQHASRLMARSRGPLFDDPGPVGEAARAVRAALHDFHEWTLDIPTVFEGFPKHVFRRSEGGKMLVTNPQLLPPGFSSGEPGKHVRATRGLLFGDTQTEVTDMAELLERRTSLAGFQAGVRAAWVSDVLDMYWLDTRPIELSEVQDWVTALADSVAPGAQQQFSVQTGPRYRTPLRLTFEGDMRPAAIGGVLRAWPGMPEGTSAVHVRLFLEPWAQIRSGQVVTAESIAK